MTLTVLWQMCDCAFNMEMKPGRVDRNNARQALCNLLDQPIPGDLDRYEIPPALEAGFFELAKLCSGRVKVNGTQSNLIHAFYYCSLTVRENLRAHCEKVGIKTVSLVKPVLPNRPRGDKDFTHSSLPYRD